MSTVALCQVCLASNTKMHHIANTPYQEIFQKLATELCTAHGRPDTVCWVCLSALRRGRWLADTARAAHEILTQLSLSGIQLNEDTLSILDRKFIRKLAWTPIQTHAINEGYEHSPTKVEIKQETSENDLTSLELELCDETQLWDQPQAEMNNTQVLLMLRHTEMDLAQEKQTGAQEVHTGCQTIFNIKPEPLSYDEVSERNCSDNNFSEIQTGKTDDVEKFTRKKERSEKVGMILSNEKFESTNIYKKKNYTQAQLQRAVTLVKQNQISLNKASKIYRIPKGTLHNKVNGKVPVAAKKGPKTFLTDDEELKLERWILHKSSLGYPLHLNGVKGIVQSFLATTAREKTVPSGFPGEKWMKLFLRRHPRITKRTEVISTTARAAVSEEFLASEDGTRRHPENIKQEMVEIPAEFEAVFTRPAETPKSKSRISLKKPKKSYETLVTGRDGQERVKHACPRCENAYTHRCHLLRHLKMHNEGAGELSRNFCCETCGKAFYTKSTLKKHRLCHSDLKRFTCDHCPTKCSQKIDMERHMTIHTGQKPYQCDVCKQRFNRKCNMLLHILTHADNKPFTCQICRMAFSRKYDLNRHTKRKHICEKPYACDICEFRSVNASYMKTHMANMHLKVNEEKPYACSVCGLKCASENSLTLHMKKKHFGVNKKTKI